MDKKEYKLLLFEYFVSKIYEWKKDSDNNNSTEITKLRLQKILFLVSAWNASTEKKGLLSTFDNFVAMQYGPVEMDIYEAMTLNNAFKTIAFNGNSCTLNGNDEIDNKINDTDKELISLAIKHFKETNANYVSRPVFELVNITHKWTAWQISMAAAELLHQKKCNITSEEICNSIVKAF